MRTQCFGEVERTILAQHRELWARIRGLVQNAERVDLPWAHEALRLLFLRFMNEFDAHLEFEECELAPRVRELDAWGPAREAALRAEHREQRRRVEEVGSLAETPGATDRASFSDAVLALSDRILEDMLHEERTLAELAAIDEHGHVDQMTG
jgi:hypothetical protein